MPERTVQLVLQYDGSRFAGWQRQAAVPTVQGEIEIALERLFQQRSTLVGSGRTDAGVHARGQSAHVRIPEKWTAEKLRRALNALLPPDIWVSASREVSDSFHARYSAISRRYAYYLGTDDEANSPFRRQYEWKMPWEISDADTLNETAAMLLGEHRFVAFAVRGTAPAWDDHACTIEAAEWRARPGGGGLEFGITGNRFLHHMVRFLVGTMVEVAAGRRSTASFRDLLTATDNSDVSAPAPPHGLFLDHVAYPEHLYLETI